MVCCWGTFVFLAPGIGSCLSPLGAPSAACLWPTRPSLSPKPTSTQFWPETHRASALSRCAPLRPLSGPCQPEPWLSMPRRLQGPSSCWRVWRTPYQRPGVFKSPTPPASWAGAAAAPGRGGGAHGLQWRPGKVLCVHSFLTDVKSESVRRFWRTTGSRDLVLHFDKFPCSQNALQAQLVENGGELGLLAYCSDHTRMNGFEVHLLRGVH